MQHLFLKKNSEMSPYQIANKTLNNNHNNLKDHLMKCDFLQIIIICKICKNFNLMKEKK